MYRFISSCLPSSNNHSKEQHHFLQKIPELKKIEKRDQIVLTFQVVKSNNLYEWFDIVPHASIRGELGECRPFQSLYEKNHKARIVITSIELASFVCDIKAPDLLQFRFENLFVPNELSENEEAHADFTGSVSFYISPNSSKMPSAEEAQIYAPNMVHLGFDLTQYIGVENAITEARSSVIPSTLHDIMGDECESEERQLYDLFHPTDPMVRFALQNHDPGMQVILTTDGTDNYYMIEKRLLTKLRALFETQLQPLILYTTFDQPILKFVPFQDKDDRRYVYSHHQEILDEADPSKLPRIVLIINVSYIVANDISIQREARKVRLQMK